MGERQPGWWVMSAEQNIDRLVTAREQFEQLLQVLTAPVPPAAAGRLAALGRTLGIGEAELAAALGRVGPFTITNPGLAPIAPAVRVQDDAGRVWDVAYEPPVVTVVGNVYDLLAHVCAPEEPTS